MAELENSKDLISVLWSGADILRSKMDANEYKDYLLGIIFLPDSSISKTANVPCYHLPTYVSLTLPLTSYIPLQYAFGYTA